jgi:hypothetical protein
VPRALAAVLLIAAAVLVAAVPAGASAVHARKVTLEIDSDISGNYSNSIDDGQDNCNARFQENAEFDYLYHFKPLTLSLASHAHAVANGKRLVASGQWHQIGTWFSGNDCKSPPQTDDCTGPVGFNRQAGPGAVSVIVSGGTVLISPASEAETIGELIPTESNCPSVKGDGGQPLFGLLSALTPWDPASAKISLKKLAQVKRGHQVTLKMKAAPPDSGFDPSGCQNASGCSGKLEASGHLFLKVLH